MKQAEETTRRSSSVSKICVQLRAAAASHFCYLSDQLFGEYTTPAMFSIEKPSALRGTSQSDSARTTPAVIQ